MEVSTGPTAFENICVLKLVYCNVTYRN